MKLIFADLDLSECSNLRQVTVKKNFLLTSVDFLVRLPGPEKLIILPISNNNFVLTILNFLKPFVNLRFLNLSNTSFGGLNRDLVKERNIQ